VGAKVIGFKLLNYPIPDYQILLRVSVTPWWALTYERMR
jgi:hypothetical protein